MLQVDAEAPGNRAGILLPRVALAATNIAAPCASHVAGMLVYNTANAGSGNTTVYPGQYYNDGTQWIRVTSIPVQRSWQGFTEGVDRTYGTTYTNSLPYEIVVNVGAHSALLAGERIILTGFVNGVKVTSATGSGNGILGNTASVSIIVPPGATYHVDLFEETPTSLWQNDHWAEYK
ncbi:hypothetical protein ACN9ML_01895 [Dyadobacter endophyticus]|uniref:hypothetical protein n=1 Tax=Dyadobacter endophyticus TaxID=1749036 RepID=UPI003CEFD3E7